MTEDNGVTYEPGLILGVAHVAFHPKGEDPAEFAKWLGDICGGMPVTGNSSRLVGRSGEGQMEVLRKRGPMHVAIRVTDIERAKKHYRQWKIKFNPAKVNTPERKVVFSAAFTEAFNFICFGKLRTAPVSLSGITVTLWAVCLVIEQLPTPITLTGVFLYKKSAQSLGRRERVVGYKPGWFTVSSSRRSSVFASPVASLMCAEISSAARPRSASVMGSS